MGQLLGRFSDFDMKSLPEWEAVMSALVVLIVGFLVLRLGTRMIMKALGKGLREQSRALLRKTIIYSGATVLFVMVLNAAGVSVGALLGAAGVVGIAIGIASQASLSNIISGLFLVSERFFEIGDVIRVGQHTGNVFAIDLLSVKIKTFDNVVIRVPNQQLIEQDLVNITRFPVRRMDFTVIVPAHERIERVLDALRSAAVSVEQVLEEPEPLLMFKEFEQNGARLLLGVWFERPNFVSVRNGVAAAIQQVFAERNISIRTTSVELITSSKARIDSFR